MGHDHSHGANLGADNEWRLRAALGLTFTFLIIEVVGGIVTASLALISDAAHMFTDATALAIALAAIRIGRRPADNKRSYGYQRFEILAAAFNALLLFGVAGYILYEAWERFRSPPEVNSTGMLAIATAGLVVNFIAMRLLSAGKDDSLNLKGAYLEVWSDLLGSAGVIVAAILIKLTGLRWIDPVVAVAIALWVLPRTWILLKASTHVLLEGTPAEIDMPKLEGRIKGFPGVSDVHDLHVWTLTSRSYVLTAHVVVGLGAAPDLLQRLSRTLREEFGIAHTTIQVEATACGDLHPPLHGTGGDSKEHGTDHDHAK